MLERPVEQLGWFTFSVLDTSEADAINLLVDPLLGTIQAMCKPERLLEKTPDVQPMHRAGRVNFLPGTSC